MSRRFNKHYAGQGVLTDPTLGIFLDWGATPPTDGTPGYGVGCLWIDTDAADGSQWLRNDGTLLSCDFNVLDGGIDLGLLTATAAEINRSSDVSTRIVPLAVSTSITEAAHDSKTIVMSGAGAARTFTLPAATGGGARFRFVVGEVNTSNYIVNSVVGTDLMEGAIIGNDGGGVTTAMIWASGATDDSVLLNGTTTGGAAIGDWVEFEDFSATGWAVRGVVTQSGAEATPFRDAVT